MHLWPNVRPIICNSSTNLSPLAERLPEYWLLENAENSARPIVRQSLAKEGFEIVLGVYDLVEVMKYTTPLWKRATVYVCTLPRHSRV